MKEYRRKPEQFKAMKCIPETYDDIVREFKMYPLTEETLRLGAWIYTYLIQTPCGGFRCMDIDKFEQEYEEVE